MIIVANEEDVSVTVSGTELEVLDASDEYVFAECDLADIRDELPTGFPESLRLQIRSEDGFKTYLFHELHIFSEAGQVVISFDCLHPNKYWEGRYGLATFLNAIKTQIDHHPELTVTGIELEDDWKRLSVAIGASEGKTFGAAIHDGAALLCKVVTEAEIALSGVTWKKEYETKESLFCTEVLAPLLRRMGFLNVRYTHGNREYGKDFTFSELTQFGDFRHYGLQAKAGDISGGVNAEIDEIIGQIKDGFEMPYYELGSKDPRYVSVFIVAISGKFTANAKEKIAEKIPKGVLGSVYFLDRESIVELVERYWMQK